MIVKYIIVFCIFTFTYGFNTVLNIDELNSIHYNIDIVNNPVLKGQEWKTDIVTVINKQGQEYVCSLPKIEIPENENKKEEDILDQLADISELLKPMEAAPCIIKRRDWWSYEFCYGSVIKQYHLEDNKVTGTILILGKYESEYNWKNSSETKNKLQKFHSQFYVNGTRCDITGEPRRTEVRFHCEEGVGDYIQQVDEPESCRYILTIATTRVCHHPYLRPSPNKSPHSISCAPSLSQDQYEQYQKLQTFRKKKAEKDRQQFLEEKHSSSDGDPIINENGRLRNIDNDEGEETKWSIQLVTIPMTKKGRLEKSFSGESTDDISKAEGIKALEGYKEMTTGEDIDFSKEQLRSQKTENLPAPASFLTKQELMEKDVNHLFSVSDTSEDENEKEEGGSPNKALKQIKAIRNKMNKMIGKWMEIQNDDHLQELSQKIAKNLGENVEQLQESASKLPDDILSDYVDEIVKIANNYKTEVESELLNAEGLEKDEEQRLVNVLDTLTKTLTDAEKEVIKAKERIKSWEKILDSAVFEDNKVVAEEDDKSSDSNSKVLPLHEVDSGSSPSLSNFPSTKSTTTFSEADPIDSNNEDLKDEEGKGSLLVNSKGDTRQVRILNEKSLDESRKTKLEQSIKKRLQNSGLDNIGRKIEVKILTPNYLDDEDKDSLSSLSQEETEAFHNMIVNILSASAEELQERERHKNMENNYNFQFEEDIEDTNEETVMEDNTKREINDDEHYEIDNIGDK